MITQQNILTVIYITIALLLNACSTLCHTQKMNAYFNKELVARVATICEETPDNNPCAGSEIFLVLMFDKQEVQVYEKELSTCGKASVNEIGVYKWTLLPNKELKIDFISEQIKHTYAEYLFLELRDKQLVGRITHLNGKVIEYSIHEKIK